MSKWLTTAYKCRCCVHMQVISLVCIAVWAINIGHFNDPAHGGSWLKVYDCAIAADLLWLMRGSISVVLLLLFLFLRSPDACRLRGCFGVRAHVVKIMWGWAPTEICPRFAIFSTKTLGFCAPMQMLVLLYCQVQCVQKSVWKTFQFITQCTGDIVTPLKQQKSPYLTRWCAEVQMCPYKTSCYVDNLQHMWCMANLNCKYWRLVGSQLAGS